MSRTMDTIYIMALHKRMAWMESQNFVKYACYLMVWCGGDVSQRCAPGVVQAAEQTVPRPIPSTVYQEDCSTTTS